MSFQSSTRTTVFPCEVITSDDNILRICKQVIPRALLIETLVPKVEYFKYLGTKTALSQSYIY